MTSTSSKDMYGVVCNCGEEWMDYLYVAVSEWLMHVHRQERDSGHEVAEITRYYVAEGR